jgi:PAS domain S-box-containing protein
MVDKQLNQPASSHDFLGNPYGPRLFLAALIPFLAATLQWLLWPYLPPQTWLFFVPAVFLSTCIGRFTGGVLSTILSAGLGTYFFIPEQFSWAIADTRHLHSIVIFLAMGGLISLVQERYQLAQDSFDKSKKMLSAQDQERLRLALESANAGLWEWNLENNTNEWSDTLWGLYGLTLNSCEPSFQAWLETIDPDDKAETAAAVIKAAQSGSEISVEWRVKDHGHGRWLMSKGKPEFDSKGKPVLYRGIVVDITNQKNLETATREREQLLDFALSTLNAGVWEVDLVSHQAKRTLLHDQIFGYPRLLDDWAYEKFLDHVLPEERPIVDQNYKTAIANHANWDIECRIRRVDGEIRWIQALGRHQKDALGRSIKLTGIIRDITESKQMAQELQRWANAFQHCAHGIAISDPNSNCILYCNPAYAAMLGFKEPKEVEGQPILQLYAPGEHELVKQYLQEANSLGKSHFESIYQRKDGSLFDVQIDLVCVKNSQNQPQYRVATAQDISERKQLESSIRDKERLLSESQAIAHVGSWMFEVQTGRLVWSDEHFRLFGLSPDSINAPTYDQFLLLLHPDDRSAMRQWIDDCQAGKEPSGLEFRSLTEDGSEHWLYGCGLLESDAQGQPLKMIGTTQDITDRKIADEERRFIETRYRALVDQAAPDAFYVHDHEGNFVEVNQKACEYDGYNKDELLKLNVLDVETDFKLTDLQATWSSIQPGVTMTLYGHHRRRDGSRFPVEVRFGLLEYNGQRLYIALVRDISERLQAEEQLLLQSKALEAAANAIMITDPKGVIEWVNPAFTALTGYSKEDAINNTTDELFRCNMRHPEVHQEVWSVISKGQMWHGEIVYQRKDGTEYTEEQTITPVIDNQGIVRHFIAIKQDITGRKQNEAVIEDYHDQLEQLVENRTRELIDAREEAVRLSQVKSSFLANMSHEIRSPMNAMMGFFYLLEQQPLEGEARELLRKARYAGQSLLAIINDILDFSKIESGNLEIEYFPFRLFDLIDQLAALMSATAGDKNLELIISPSPLFADHLIGDGLRLQQVLVNLCSNAIKFTEQGEVELIIKLVKVLQGNKIKMYFAVRDTGMGISEEKRNEIFNAFAQADTSISRRFGGSGLGLAISRQLVNLMGGTLQLESEPGKGSKFWFELELERDKTLENTPKELKYLELLVADDCNTARKAIVSTANALGWVAESVDTGEAAYSHYMQRVEAHHAYDVILLDWKMPGMDGLTTAKAIKQSLASGKNKNDRIPIVIMVSAYSRDVLMDQNDTQYVDIILSKPVTLSSLYNAILAIVRKRRPGADSALKQLPNHKKYDLSGIRVLVVDDSDVNREIAQSILTLHKAEVSLVKDGHEAIAWLENHAHAVDIILMDIQMPGMDGYETTSHIRQDARWHKLPIVALTAGAFTDDQETARRAGMDEFITKPFNVDRLISVIQRLTGNKAELTATSESSGNLSYYPLSSSPSAFSSLDLSLPSINVEEGVKRFGDEFAYFTYLAKFITAYSNAGNEIMALVKSGNVQTASALTHKLKGAAGNLALKHIYHFACAIEARLDSGLELIDTGKFLQNALTEASELINALRKPELDKNQIQLAESTSDTYPVELLSLLEQFLLALDKDNPTATEALLIQLKINLSADDFDLIQEKIADFDFKAAKNKTLDLINKLRPA